MGRGLPGRFSLIAHRAGNHQRKICSQSAVAASGGAAQPTRRDNGGGKLEEAAKDTKRVFGKRGR